MAQQTLKEAATPLIQKLVTPQGFKSSLNHLGEQFPSTKYPVLSSGVTKDQMREIEQSLLLPEMRSLANARGRKTNISIEDIGTLSITRRGNWLIGRTVEAELYYSNNENPISISYLKRRSAGKIRELQYIRIGNAIVNINDEIVEASFQKTQRDMSASVVKDTREKAETSYNTPGHTVTITDSGGFRSREIRHRIHVVSE